MKVKGIVIESSIDYIKEKFGDDGIQKIISQLTPEEKTLFQFGICKAMWYEVDFHIHITDLILKTFYPDQEPVKILREIGAFTAEHDQNSIKKIVYRLGTPVFMAHFGSWNFNRFYDVGKIKVLKSDSGTLILIADDLPMYHEYIFERMAGWMKRAIELCGGQEVAIDPTVKKVNERFQLIFQMTWK